MTPAFPTAIVAIRRFSHLFAFGAGALLLSGCPASMENDCAATATCAPPPDAAVGDGSSDGSRDSGADALTDATPPAAPDGATGDAG